VSLSILAGKIYPQRLGLLLPCDIEETRLPGAPGFFFAARR
jgi:hypothetical protein